MTLTELSCLVLHNLDKVKGSGWVEQLLEPIGGTVCAGHKEVYEDVLAYFRASGSFPDSIYVLNKFGGRAPRVEGEFSESVLRGFVIQVQKEAVIVEAQRFLLKGDAAGAQTILRKLNPKGEGDGSIGLSGIGDVFDEMFTRPAGIKTGIPELDEVLTAAPYGSLGVIAAPPSRGKSMTAKSIVFNNSVKAKFNSLVITLEDSTKFVWFDLICRNSVELGERLNSEHVKKATLDSKGQALFHASKKDLQEKGAGDRIKILGTADFQLFATEAFEEKIWKEHEAFQLKTGSGLDLVVLDYIQQLAYMRPQGTEPIQFMNDFVGWMAALAKNFEKPRGLISILLAQVNRDGERRILKNERADMRCLAELNSLERSADWITVFYATEQERLSNVIRLQLIKHRMGRVMDGMVSTFFDPEVCMIGTEGVEEIYSSSALATVNENAGAITSWE